MDLFSELSILIAVATGVAVIMRLLHQPLIIGHIITGLVVGPFVLDLVHSTETLAVLGEIGIAILLFTVGLNLNPMVIRRFGGVALVSGIGQVVFTSIIGFVLSMALGFDALSSFYIAVALSFSSTIIIMKLISDRGELDVLYAKLAVGFLLVQDLIAVLLLFAMPLLSEESVTVVNALPLVFSGALLVGFVMLASRFFVSRASEFISRSQEFLFLFAIAWGIGVAALFQHFGFSLESGALAAGIALASLPARHEISSRLTPLRDFFIVMFFIFLGAQMQFGDLYALLPAATVLSVLVLVGNPLILMALLGFLGYRKKTSLQTGLTVAQISEFSLIFVALGVSLGHISQPVLSLVTFVGLVTIFGSTYLVTYSEKIYNVFSPYLGLFERADAREYRTRHSGRSVVLFGCNRIGYDFLQSLKELGEHFLVVDYDPVLVEQLQEQGIDVEFGDASDAEFLQNLDLRSIELAISTIPDSETNVLLHRLIKEANPASIVLVVAHRVADALSHYDEGIDYVILPHFLGGKHAAELVVRFQKDKGKYDKLRGEHIEHLKLRLSAGQEHPAQHR